MARKKPGSIRRIATDANNGAAGGHVSAGGDTQKGQGDGRVPRLIKDGRKLFDMARYGAAQQKFQQAINLCDTSVTARSHLALSHLMQGEDESAEHEARAALRLRADDVIALSALARVQLFRGRRHEANYTIVRTLNLFYARHRAAEAGPDELVHVAHMLTALSDDHRLYQLYKRCVRGVAGPWSATLLTHFGIAAFNIGRFGEARWLWRDALRRDTTDEEDADTTPVPEVFLFLLRRVEEGTVPPWLLDYNIDPEEVGDDEDEPSGFVKALALRTLWDAGGAHARAAALDLLCQADEGWVSNLLFQLVRVPDLADSFKVKVARQLVERGLLGADEPLEMHIDGELQPVFVEHGSEPALPAEALELLAEAVAANEEGDEGRAEEAYRAILDIVPDFVPVLIDLADICRRGGRRDEARTLLERAIDTDPNHPMALFNLAVLLTQQKQFSRADELLRRLRVVELPAEARGPFYGLLGHVALGLNDAARAEEAFSKGLEIAPDNEGLRAGLEVAARHVQKKSKDASQDKKAAPGANERRRYEARPIAPTDTWPAALCRHTKRRLQAMGRHVGLSGLWSQTKSRLADALAASLRDGIARVWNELSDEERRALRWVAAAGGTVPLDALHRRFGDDDADGLDWWEKAPASVSMRLQYKGLLFVGTRAAAEGPVAVLLDDVHDSLRRHVPEFTEPE